jgi:hypothetical protein
MKAKNIENNLALAGALIVLVGVSFAAEDALGFETTRQPRLRSQLRSRTGSTLISN